MFFWIFFLGLPVVGGLTARYFRHRPAPRPWIGLGAMALTAIISWAVLGAMALGAGPGFLVAATFSMFGYFAPELERLARRHPRVVLIIGGLTLVIAIGFWVSHNPRAANGFWNGLNATGLVGAVITLGIVVFGFRVMFGRGRRH